MTHKISEKQHGDAKRIFDLYEKRCRDKGVDNLKYCTVRAMLNGSRTISEDVAQVAETYFRTMEQLTETITI